MVGDPLMRFFQRHIRIGNYHAGKNFSAALTLITFIFIFVALIWTFVPIVIQQARNLGDIDYAKIVQGLEEPINDWNNWFVEKGFMEGEIAISKDSLKSLTMDSLRSDSMANLIIIPLKIDTIDLVESVDDQQVLSSTVITIDSILMANGDTITKTNIALNINVKSEEPKEKIRQAIDPTAVVKESDTPIEKLQKQLFSFFNPARIPELFGTLIGFLGNLLIAIMSVLFITFFFLREQGLFAKIASGLVSDEYEGKMLRAIDDASKLLRRYFIGIVVQISTITIFVTAALTLLGIENALLIGFFAALINLIPYIGPIIGGLFGMFIVLSSNLDLPFYEETLPLLVKVFCVFATMQALDNFLLQPTIFSNSVLAHPLEIFIIILVGAKVWGITGMVIAIPVYTILRVIARAFWGEFYIVKKITGGMGSVDNS